MAEGQNKAYVLNKGIGGNSSHDLLQRMHHDVLDLKPDMVIVLVGTNDLMNTNKMVPAHQYIENLGRLTDTLASHDIKIVIVSPPPVDEVYLFERHDPAFFQMPPNKILEDAATAIKNLCKKKGYLLIDFFEHLKSKGIPDHNKDDIILNDRNSGKKDGVHLTKAGNVLLAQLIFEKITDRYGPLKRYKIICFGDSLTYGAFMMGEGTTDGDTYPAVLNRIINEYKN